MVWYGSALRRVTSTAAAVSSPAPRAAAQIKNGRERHGGIEETAFVASLSGRPACHHDANGPGPEQAGKACPCRREPESVEAYPDRGGGTCLREGDRHQDRVHPAPGGCLAGAIEGRTQCGIDGHRPRAIVGSDGGLDVSASF